MNTMSVLQQYALALHVPPTRGGAISPWHFIPLYVETLVTNKFVRCLDYDS